MVEEKFLVDILNPGGGQQRGKAPRWMKLTESQLARHRENRRKVRRKIPDLEAGLIKKTSPCWEGINIPNTDHILRAVCVPDSKGLRSRENGAVRQYKYVDELFAELDLAVLGGKSRDVKCHRRALTSGLRLVDEAIIPTAEAHKWTTVRQRWSEHWMMWED
jgi:hypothetical protein